MVTTDIENVNPPVARVLARLSWSSIFAGLLVAIATMVVLGELMAALGLSVIRPASGDLPEASTVVAAGAIGWVVSSIIALFIGGWTAAYVDRCGGRVNNNFDGALHGALVWSLATLVIIVMAGTVLGGTISGVLSATKTVATTAGSAVGGAGGGLGEVAKSMTQNLKPEYNWDSIRNQAENLFARANQGTASQPSIGNAAGQARSSAVTIDPLAQVVRYFSKPEAQRTDTDRRELITSISIHAGLSPEQATKQVEQWEGTALAAKQDFEQKMAAFQQQSRQAAETAAKSASLAAFYALAATLLGLSAAMVGGHLGGNTRAPTQRTREQHYVPHPA
jgi:hypothetical protein